MWIFLNCCCQASFLGSFNHSLVKAGITVVMGFSTYHSCLCPSFLNSFLIDAVIVESRTRSMHRADWTNEDNKHPSRIERGQFVLLAVRAIIRWIIKVLKLQRRYSEALVISRRYSAISVDSRPVGEHI